MNVEISVMDKYQYVDKVIDRDIDGYIHRLLEGLFVDAVSLLSPNVSSSLSSCSFARVAFLPLFQKQLLYGFLVLA